MRLEDYISSIKGADKQAMEDSEKFCLGLLKIPGSMGRLEDIAIKLAGVTGKTKNEFKKKCIIIMSADNGIAAQGVSNAPQDITVTLTECFSKNVTGVGVVSRVAGSDLIVYDVGIAGDIRDPAVINKKIRRGTRDMSQEAAMTKDECEKAIMIGIEAVKDALDKGYNLIGTGEMGIGNTSTTTCIVCALTGAPVDECVGAGTGMIDDESRQRKAKVLKRVLEVNKPNPDDVLDVVTKVGGYDIAALIGVYIGAAYYRVPVVIDGYISSAAALCAYRLNPLAYDYMLESHITEEAGYKAILRAAPFKPMFAMNMRLGEGSGCPFTFFAIDCANSMMNNMYTFDQVEVDSEYKARNVDLKF